jgi:hypothetical protein
MTTDRGERVTTFDPATFPLVDPYPPFSWVRPTDAAVAALLDDDEDPQVLAECDHIALLGQVVSTQCDSYLCGDCAASHRCRPCDADAYAYGED